MGEHHDLAQVFTGSLEPWGGGVGHRLEPRREGGGCYAGQAQSGALGLGWGDASGFRSYSKFETAGFTGRQKVGVRGEDDKARGLRVGWGWRCHHGMRDRGRDRFQGEIKCHLGWPQTPIGRRLAGDRISPSPPGYGYTTPLTDAGKAFSIAFALLGVPATMLLLTSSAQRLSLLLDRAPLSWLTLRCGWDFRRAARWHLVALLGVVLTVCFLVPAAVFAHLEEAWSFLDALYFCFISLSTIGLGDYVPGEAPNQPYRALYKVLVTGEWGGWPGTRGREGGTAWASQGGLARSRGSEHPPAPSPRSLPLPGPGCHDAGAAHFPPRV